MRLHPGMTFIWTIRYSHLSGSKFLVVYVTNIHTKSLYKYFWDFTWLRERERTRNLHEMTANLTILMPFGGRKRWSCDLWLLLYYFEYHIGKWWMGRSLAVTSLVQSILLCFLQTTGIITWCKYSAQLQQLHNRHNRQHNCEDLTVCPNVLPCKPRC
jgi:hypothetical protein